MDATAAVCEPRRKPFADYESVFPRRAASPDPSIAYEISTLVHKLFGRKQRMDFKLGDGATGLDGANIKGSATGGSACPGPPPGHVDPGNERPSHSASVTATHTTNLASTARWQPPERQHDSEPEVPSLAEAPRHRD
jgi:hypothetical protein